MMWGKTRRLNQDSRDRQTSILTARCCTTPQNTFQSPALQLPPTPSSRLTIILSCATMSRPAVHTYHCLCSSLLFATTHSLNSLPRRSGSALDKAVILPLPPPPAVESTPSPEPEEAENEDGANEQPQSRNREENKNSLPPLGYTVLLGMTLDRKPTVVRRQDGFEKRYLWRCGRCRLVVGYKLDQEHFTNQEDGLLPATEEPRGTVAFILPNGVLSTEAMAAGRKIAEGEVDLASGDTAVAAWES